MGGKPRPEKKYQLVILNFGYVESSSLSTIFFLNRDGYFESKKEAVSHLASSLLTMFLGVQEEYRDKRLQCCEEVIATASSARYCPKCGRPVKADYNFEEFEGWLQGLPKEDADSFPCVDDWIHWWPWLSWKEILRFSDRAVEIEDSAEQVLPTMVNIDLLRKHAGQEVSRMGMLDLDAIERAWKEWVGDRDLSYLKRKIK